MIEPSPRPPDTSSAQPTPAEQSFGLVRLLLCFVAFGAVASLARNVSANLAVPVLAGGVGCALLVIAIRRRHWPLIASLTTYANIGLLLGAIACDSYYGPAVGQLVTISSVLLTAGLIVLIVSGRGIVAILLRAICALIGALLVIFLTPGAPQGDPLVLFAGPIGSLAGWGLACLPAETIKAKGESSTD